MVRRLSETPGYTENPVVQQDSSEGVSTPVQEDSPPSSSPSVTPNTIPGQAVQNQSNPTEVDTDDEIVSDAINTVSAGAEAIVDELSPEPVVEAPWAGYSNKLSGLVGRDLYDIQPRNTVDRSVQNMQGSYTRPDGTEYESVLSRITKPVSDQPAIIQNIVDAYKNSPDSFTLSRDRIVDRTSEGSNWNFGNMQADSLVIHHTAGRPTVEGTIQTFKDRGFPAHFIIDREGVVHQVLGLNQKGQHTKNSEVPGLNINNSNSWGVEIIARNDSDVNEAQVQAAIGLAKFLNQEFGMPMDRVVGHGYINSHKERTEGQTVVSTLQQILS